LFYVSISLMSSRWLTLDEGFARKRNKWKPDFRQLGILIVNAILYALVYILATIIDGSSDSFWSIYYAYNTVTLFILTMINFFSGLRLYRLHKAKYSRTVRRV
jgi:hypothetical protein